MNRATPRPNEHDHEDDQHPFLTSDLVMKGGITPRAHARSPRSFGTSGGDARPGGARDWSPS
jgi:hypothetical protein